MADNEVHWSSAAARARYAAEEAERVRPKTLAERIYGKAPADPKAARLAQIRAGIAKPTARPR